MAIVGRVNPVGADRLISNIQDRIYGNLILKGWADYESYDRAYINNKGGGTIPEVYIGENEYKEVLMDDKFTASSFFLVDTTRSFEEGNFSQTISIIFQADIVELYPTIAHRADEEMHNDIVGSLEEYEGYLSNITTGVPGVYSALSIPDDYIDRVNNDDMSNYHVVKIDLEIPYQYCN